MANNNTPFGLRAVGALTPASTSGAVKQFAVPASDATQLLIGDVVKLTGASVVVGDASYGVVTRAASGDLFVGVVTGVIPVDRSSPKYREASVLRIVTVDCDPNSIFEAQDVITGTPMTTDDIGLNVNLLVAAGSTVTGLSGTTLDNTSKATTNTLDLKIVGLPNRADNDLSTSATGKKFLVKFNRHAYANQTTGV